MVVGYAVFPTQRSSALWRYTAPSFPLKIVVIVFTKLILTMSTHNNNGLYDSIQQNEPVQGDHEGTDPSQARSNHGNHRGNHGTAINDRFVISPPVDTESATAHSSAHPLNVRATLSATGWIPPPSPTAVWHSTLAFLVPLCFGTAVRLSVMRCRSSPRFSQKSKALTLLSLLHSVTRTVQNSLTARDMVEHAVFLMESI